MDARRSWAPWRRSSRCCPERAERRGGTGAADGGAVLMVVLRRPARVALGSRVITAASPRRGPVLEDFDLDSGRRRLRAVSPLEVDDHDDPGLVFFRERLFVSRRRTAATCSRATAEAGTGTGSRRRR